MAKFHINAKGVPAPCKAKKGNCPFGGEIEHYPSREEAQKAADKANQAVHDLLPTVSNQENFEKTFKELENLIKTAPSRTEQEFERTRLAKLVKARNNGGTTEETELTDIFANVHEPDGGATMSFSNGKVTVPTSGFCASPYPEFSKVFNSAKEVDFESLMCYVGSMEEKGILNSPETYLGLWHDPETGKVYLDISKRYDSAEDARIACEESDQIAYFDLQLFESVDVDRNAMSGQTM